MPAHPMFPARLPPFIGVKQRGGHDVTPTAATEARWIAEQAEEAEQLGMFPAGFDTRLALSALSFARDYLLLASRTGQPEPGRGHPYIWIACELEELARALREIAHADEVRTCVRRNC